MSTWIRITVSTAPIALAAPAALAKSAAPDILTVPPVQKQLRRSDEFTYRGFRFDTAAITRSVNEQALVASA